MLTLDRGVMVSDLIMPEGVTTRVAGEISVITPVISRAAKMALSEATEDGEGDEASDEGEA